MKMARRSASLCRWYYGMLLLMLISFKGLVCCVAFEEVFWFNPSAALTASYDVGHGKSVFPIWEKDVIIMTSSPNSDGSCGMLGKGQILENERFWLA